METVTVFGKGPKTEVAATLIIKDFVEVMEASKPGEYYETDEFMVKETAMRLRVYPNGRRERCRGWVSVWLGENWGLGMKSTFITDVKSKENKKGYSKLFSTEEAKEYYKEKDFVVNVKVEMEGEVVKIAGENTEMRKRKAISQEVSETAFRKMFWTDFTLVFEGEELACHRLILAGASRVLAAMLEPASKHREAVEGRVVIQLPAAVGRAFLRFIYLEEIEEDILTEEVVAFLELGEMYEVERLKELAEEKMLQLLERGNMVEFLIAGDMFRAMRIKVAALQLAKIHLTWLRGEGREELHKLSQDLLIELL